MQLVVVWVLLCLYVVAAQTTESPTTLEYEVDDNSTLAPTSLEYEYEVNSTLGPTSLGDTLAPTPLDTSTPTALGDTLAPTALDTPSEDTPAPSTTLPDEATSSPTLLLQASGGAKLAATALAALLWAAH